MLISINLSHVLWEGVAGKANMRTKNPHPSTVLMTIFERADPSPHKCMIPTSFKIWTFLVALTVPQKQYGLYQCVNSMYCMNSACNDSTFLITCFTLLKTYVQTSISLLKNEWLATNVKLKNLFTYEVSIYLLEKLGKNK